MAKIINTTPHMINFRDADGNEFVVPPCGTLINARPMEEPVGERNGAVLVRTKFVADPISAEELTHLEAENPGAIFVGSIIAAQAFPGRVVGMIPASGYERAPTEQKRMNPVKFTVF